MKTKAYVIHFHVDLSASKERTWLKKGRNYFDNLKTLKQVLKDEYVIGSFSAAIKVSTGFTQKIQYRMKHTCIIRVDNARTQSGFRHLCRSFRPSCY